MAPAVKRITRGSSKVPKNQRRLFDMPKKMLEPKVDLQDEKVRIYRDFFYNTALQFLGWNSGYIHKITQKGSRMRGIAYSVLRNFEEKRRWPSSKQLGYVQGYLAMQDKNEQNKETINIILDNIKCIKILNDLENSVNESKFWELEQKEKELAKAKLRSPENTIYQKIIGMKEMKGLEYDF
ncbi:MAG: hypothetical protein ABIH83_00170 [Candidatus Micrarchaeota archaeon]